MVLPMIATSSPKRRRRIRMASMTQRMSGCVQQVVRDLDVVGRLVDRLAHPDGRPVVLLLPLHLAAERRRLLDDREDRHDRVEAELRVAGRRQSRHQLRVAVGVRERGVDEVHQLDRGHRRRVDDRGAVDRLAPECGEDALAGWSSGRRHRCSMVTRAPPLLRARGDEHPATGRLLESRAAPRER